MIWRKIKKGQFWLALIVLTGALLRIIGVNFGLPHLYHPDEWALVMPALRMLQTGVLDPQRFDYGSLYIYMQAVVQAIFYVYSRITGQLFVY